MDKLTYQENGYSSPLEQYEWTRVWFEDTYDQTAKRVAYIGDSISQMTHGHANLLTDRKILFNNLATSKAVDNPHYGTCISMFLSEHSKLDAIIINNGLHGWHLSEEEYKACYSQHIQAIKAAYPQVPLYILLTTAITRQNEACDRVSHRNTMAQQIALENKLPVIDLYTVSLGIADTHLPDGVHFNNDGYRVLAQTIIDELPF